MYKVFSLFSFMHESSKAYTYKVCTESFFFKLHYEAEPATALVSHNIYA